MPLKDMATSTAAFVLLRYEPSVPTWYDLGSLTYFMCHRTLGGTVGISVGQAIWSSVSHISMTSLCIFADMRGGIRSLFPFPLAGAPETHSENSQLYGRHVTSCTHGKRATAEEHHGTSPPFLQIHSQGSLSLSLANDGRL